MIVCQCANVSDTTLHRVIDAGASTLAQICRLTGAGRCCAPCREEICRLLYSRGRLPHIRSTQAAAAESDPV